MNRLQGWKEYETSVVDNVKLAITDLSRFRLMKMRAIRAHCTNNVLANRIHRSDLFVFIFRKDKLKSFTLGANLALRSTTEVTADRFCFTDWTNCIMGSMNFLTKAIMIKRWYSDEKRRPTWISEHDQAQYDQDHCTRCMVCNSTSHCRWHYAVIFSKDTDWFPSDQTSNFCLILKPSFSTFRNRICVFWICWAWRQDTSNATTSFPVQIRIELVAMSADPVSTWLNRFWSNIWARSGLDSNPGPCP